MTTSLGRPKLTVSHQVKLSRKRTFHHFMKKSTCCCPEFALYCVWCHFHELCKVNIMVTLGTIPLPPSLPPYLHVPPFESHQCVKIMTTLLFTVQTVENDWLCTNHIGVGTMEVPGAGVSLLFSRGGADHRDVC